MFCLSTVELATSKAMLAAYRASEEQGDGKHRLYRCGIRKASLRLSSHPICSVSSVSRHHEARLHDAATVEVMLAITLTPMRRCSPPTEPARSKAMASIASTAAASARPACGCHLTLS